MDSSYMCWRRGILQGQDIQDHIAKRFRTCVFSLVGVVSETWEQSLI